MLHEMGHLYKLQNEIQDVSNNGYHHNLKFKAISETHGMHIEKHPKYGWTVTIVTPETEAWLREALGARTVSAQAACRKKTAREAARNPSTGVLNMYAPNAVPLSGPRGRSTWYVVIAAYHSSVKNKSGEIKKYQPGKNPGWCNDVRRYIRLVGGFRQGLYKLFCLLAKRTNGITRFLWIGFN